jgi:transposase
MQSKETPRARRVHGAQIKAQVMAECRPPGASVAAVALAHGLNANLVRNWLHGMRPAKSS